jgi:hypothetical protein
VAEEDTGEACLMDITKITEMISVSRNNFRVIEDSMVILKPISINHLGCSTTMIEGTKDLEVSKKGAIDLITDS